MSAKRIRLATFCTEQEVQKSESYRHNYHNKATKSIFLDLLKSNFRGEADIKIPLEEFAQVVWMTYLLRTPSNKGNVKRDKKGNRVVDTEAKKCIHNTEASHFVSLSDNEKESRCMHVIKHLRKYFKIVDGKTEWTVAHSKFATAKSLNEEVIENILPNRSSPTKKPDASPSLPRTRSKRKRTDSEDEEETSAIHENQKRRRKSSDSDVSSSYSASVVSSPDSCYQAPDSPSEELDHAQSPQTTNDTSVYGGDFQSNLFPQQQVDLYWYSMMVNPYCVPVYFPPASGSWE